jgi:stress-induced-phosphoprotein 1
MSSGEIAALKEQGNELYLQKHFAEAVRVSTQALELDPTNHVLYSNRYVASLRKEGDLAATTAALWDAIKCTELQPEWAKGFFRLGAAREKLEQFPEVCISVC